MHGHFSTGPENNFNNQSGFRGSQKNILISKKEFQVFQEIIRVAQNDQWEEARLMAYRLRDNQEPTDADQEKLNMRELPPMKKPGSNRKK